MTRQGRADHRDRAAAPDRAARRRCDSRCRRPTPRSSTSRSPSSARSTSAPGCSASTPRSTTPTSATPTSSCRSRATSRSGSAGAPSPTSSRSVGGFHPGYTPAAHLQLPPMRRLTLCLLKDNPRITLSMYFAVTTNTRAVRGHSSSCTSGSSGSRSRASSASTCSSSSRRSTSRRTSGRGWRSRGRHRASARSRSTSRSQGPTPWIAHGTASFKILFFIGPRDARRHARRTRPRRRCPGVRRARARCSTRSRTRRAWAAELAAGTASLVTLLAPAPGRRS